MCQNHTHKGYSQEDLDAALKLKSEGNDFFRNKNYEKALERYTKV